MLRAKWKIWVKRKWIEYIIWLQVQKEANKEEEIEGNSADTEHKVNVQPESTESDADLGKEEVSEDSEEIIENKNKDDHQEEEVAEQIEANVAFETNSENEAVSNTKINKTKEKPELEIKVESDTSWNKLLNNYFSNFDKIYKLRRCRK